MEARYVGGVNNKRRIVSDHLLFRIHDEKSFQSILRLYIHPVDISSPLRAPSSLVRY